MNPPRVRHLSMPGLGLGAALLMAAAFSAVDLGATVDDLLTETMGFSTAELRALDAGSPAIKSLDTPVREELAHVGVVYVDAPTGRVLERFRDVERFEKGPGVPQIGRFSTLPRLEDLESLTLPATDVAALQTCRPGDCDVKLSAAAMRRFQTDVGWSSSDAARQANEVARTICGG